MNARVLASVLVVSIVLNAFSTAIAAVKDERGSGRREIQTQVVR